MSDEEKKMMIALMLGDIEGSPYYPLFTDAQYGQFLAMGKGSVNSAVVFAAISASFIVSSESTREQIGDLSIARSTGTNYLKALGYLVKNAKSQIPANLMPWVGGLGERNKLLDFRLCDKKPLVCDTRPKARQPCYSPSSDLAVAGTETDIVELRAELGTAQQEVTGTSSEMTAVKQRVLDTENVNVAQGVLIDAQGGYINTLKADTKYVGVDYLYGGDDGYSS